MKHHSSFLSILLFFISAWNALSAWIIVAVQIIKRSPQILFLAVSSDFRFQKSNVASPNWIQVDSLFLHEWLWCYLLYLHAFVGDLMCPPPLCNYNKLFVIIPKCYSDRTWPDAWLTSAGSSHCWRAAALLQAQQRTAAHRLMGTRSLHPHRPEYRY